MSQYGVQALVSSSNHKQVRALRHEYSESNCADKFVMLPSNYC